MLIDYLSKKRVRSADTAITYDFALRAWSKSRGTANPDAAVQEIKEKHLDPYQVLQDFVISSQKDGRAPKTITTYLGAVKGFLVDSDVEISSEKVKQKVVVPQAYEISTDRAPTREEMKRILLQSKLPTKTIICMLASSGMRIGELTQLKVGNITFGKIGESSKIILKAGTTKTRKRRVVFISGEATELLREYLGDHVNQLDTTIFPERSNALYGRVMRSLIRTGLRKKLDVESARYELHPHCFRKYFFSNMLSAGVDRGLVEGFMGHSFGLDSSYLRLSDDELQAQYGKGIDRLTFLSSASNGAMKDTIKELREQNKELMGRLDRLEALSVERLMLAAANTKLPSQKRRKST